MVFPKSTKLRNSGSEFAGSVFAIGAFKGNPTLGTASYIVSRGYDAHKMSFQKSVESTQLVSIENNLEVSRAQKDYLGPLLMGLVIGRYVCFSKLKSAPAPSDYRLLFSELPGSTSENNIKYSNPLSTVVSRCPKQ